MTVVRFAPSPTGYLHLGSARTALVNWLYARRTGGKFLLRIEDTDRERSRKEFLEEIIEDLKWMGLDWDSEPIYQSRRFDVYREKARKILDERKAYAEGEAVIYRVEKGRTIEIDDIIHGRITFSTDEIKDQVMIKSDGSPAYNFSCVVDDVHLGVTHIIRGDDHISNTPKQILFYEALGFEPPKFAHMPLMMGPDGGKLSKRHGAVAVKEYRKEGFLSEALVNYLMLLGWSPGDDREMISLEEARGLFRLEDMKDAQAKFDIQKLRWLNGEYIMSKRAEELFPFVREQLERSGVKVDEVSEGRVTRLIELYKIRIKTFKDFVSLTDCFFGDSYNVDEKGKKKYLEGAENRKNLGIFAESLERIDDFTAANIEAVCRSLAEEKGLKAAEIIHPARMAVSGKTEGAGLFEMMEILGKEKVLERIKKAAQ